MLSLSRAKAGLGAVALAATIGIIFPGLASADSGVATWYGAAFQGNEMYDGQIFNMYDPTTTACNIYPIGTWLRVTNPANGHSVVVQVRDRGAFSHALDLSYAAFKTIANPALMGIHVNYQVVSGPSGKPVSTPAPAPAEPAPKPSSSSPSPKDTYVVQSGDTLNGIAEQTGISAAKLAAWNNLANPDDVVIGSTLRLTAPPAPAPKPPAARSYVVQPGDTLLGIASQAGVSTAVLIDANHLTNPDDIVVGTKLSIPTKVSAKAPSTTTYTVKPGESISGIADDFGIPIGSLISANQISNPAIIQPGTKLTIPAG